MTILDQGAESSFTSNRLLMGVGTGESAMTIQAGEGWLLMGVGNGGSTMMLLKKVHTL